MPFVMDQDVRPQNQMGDQKAFQQQDKLPRKNVAQVNGAVQPPMNGAIPNGVPAQKEQPGMANGHHVSGEVLPPKQIPPELSGEWRSGMTNKSMGTMLSRLSQACFNDLNKTLSDMADQPLQQQSGQPNGDIPNKPDTDEGSLSRKRTFMTFAKDQRDRFIKALVLSDWARNADDMARLIDVLEWQRRQDQNQVAGMDNIGYIKRELAAAKMPNPNIVGALELLGTGKSPSRMPDMGYLPPKKLTAKQLLRTLQDMNVILATRLNLHEDLPQYLKDYSIANGRATFRVAGEFEIDLSVADEDTSTPFYFIDFRFSFTPAPSTVGERIRNELDVRTNHELSTQGLQGAFDFLHNFVLTHKINVLRGQFRKLLEQKWFDCARAEARGRVLLLQYWLGRKGRKSWLEIGVNTGKQQKRRLDQRPAAQLSIRWFRDGDLVENPGIEIDWDDPDLERIMSAVVARHISWTLEYAKARLESLNGKPEAGLRLDSKLGIRSTTSDTDPDACALQLSLPGLQSPFTLKVEPISGRFSITPQTQRSANIERHLNNDEKAHTNLFDALSTLLCRTVQDRVDKARQLVGWAVLNHQFGSKDLKANFGDINCHRVYSCHPKWEGSWAVVATYSLAGHKWWLVRVQDQSAQTGSAPAKRITSAKQLSVGDALSQRSTISRSSLLRVEEMAVAEVSFAVLSQQLSSTNIPYRIEKTSSLTFQDDSAVPVSDPSIALFFRGSSVLKDACGKELAVDCVRLTHRGFRIDQSDDQDIAEMSHEIRLAVETGKLKHLREYLKTQNQDADISMNQSGALALRLHSAFGKPFIDQIVSRVRSCDLLDRYLAVMRSNRYKPTVIHLNKIAFIYREPMGLSATITFAGANGTSPMRLELKPVGSNPHQRIRVHLEKVLSSRSNQPSLIGTVLEFSFPCMLAFETIEGRDTEHKATSIHVRNPLNYLLSYNAPLPVVRFTIEMNHRTVDGQKINSWYVRCDKSKQDLQSSDFGRALLEFAGKKTDLWWGADDGSVIAQPKGMQSLLEKLDDVVRRFKAEDAVPKQEAPPVVDAKPGPSQPRPQQQQPKPPPSQQQRPNQPKPGLSRPNGPAPTANMAPSRSSQGNKPAPPPKKEIIELD